MKPLTLVPFFYFLTTRIGGLRDFAYLVATSWLPAVWILMRLAGQDWLEAAATFAIGYMAFIALYELGYLLNDAWDAAKAPGGRKRIPFGIGPLYIGAFVLVRLATLLSIGWLTGWIGNIAWLGCFAALAFVFIAHNLISSASVRAASFYQLATFRFLAPVVGAIPRDQIITAVTVALLFYTYFRFLSYLDSKDLLQMAERREPQFGLTQTLLLAPLVLFLAYAMNAALLVEALVYFAVVYAGWALLGRGRRGDASP